MFDETFDQSKSLWTKDTRGIDFIEARAVWTDPEAIEGPGNRTDGEDRWLKIGRIGEKIWTIGFTYRKTGIRIFTVRPTRKYERNVYYGY